MSETTGFVLVDKAGGWTSHDVVGKARGIFGMRKIGHAGTLDPMATGLVVLGLGRATRLLRFVQGQTKEYEATAVFGVATDSLDADGDVVSRDPMDVSETDVRTVLDQFTGDIMQVPPMVSAIKIDGKRLYDLARKGEEVEREARPVVVHSIAVEGFAVGDFPKVTFRVVCGTGTYIRTLADDIAQALGGRAHLIALRRVRNGALHVDDARSVDELDILGATGRLNDSILAPSEALENLQDVNLTEEQTSRARNGARLALGALELTTGDGFVRAMSEGTLVGVYRIEGNELVPEVVLA